MSGLSEVRKNVDERDVSDVEGIRELTAELAKPHHARARFRVCSAKNDERKQQEHTCRIVEAVERKATEIGKFRHLEDHHEKKRKSQKPNLGAADTTLNTVEPKAHDEGD